MSIKETIKDLFTKSTEVELKESFDSSLDDTALIQQIKAWELESEDFYSLLKRVWEQNLLYYHGQQTGVEKIRGKKSKAVENRIHMAVETGIPIATSRLPELDCEPGEESEQAEMDADDLQDILKYHLSRTDINIQAKSELFLRDMIVKRYGVFKVPWNKERDDVSLQRIDPRRIRIPKYGQSVRELAFVIEDLELSYDSLEKFFGKEKADECIKNGFKNPETQVRKKTFAVQEVWTNNFVAWKAGELILDKKVNPTFDFEDKARNFFDEPSKPYVIKSLFETDESLIGDTDYVQTVIPIQDNINIRKRQIEDIISKVANPPLLIDSDVMSEEQAANITNEEGLIIYGKDAANGTKVRFENPGQVPNYLFLDLEGSRQQFDNIWGIHSTTRGEREGKETLGGRQLLRAADLGRIDSVSRQLERALGEIAEWWTQYIKLFYTEERSFSISGEDGTRFVKKFKADKIGKNVRPRVVPGTTLPKDEITQRQEAVELWSLKALGIRTLYKKLKMSNVEDAVQDFIDTQSGAILQPQGSPVQQQAGIPAAPPTVEPQI